MTIILDIMTNRVIIVSSIILVVGIILYLSLRFIDVKHPRIVAAMSRIGMDAMIIAVALISVYTVIYFVIG